MAKVYLNPTAVIKSRLQIDENGPAQRYFQSLCDSYMQKYIPYRDGDLRKNRDLSNPKQIVYESPYARYMFYGKKMVMPENGKSAFYSPDYGFWSIKDGKKVVTDEDLVYHTRGTKAYWHKEMWTAEGKAIEKKLQKFIDRWEQ